LNVTILKGDTELDSGPLKITGTIMPGATRGFIEDIQLRIDEEGWRWTLGVRGGAVAKSTAP